MDNITIDIYNKNMTKYADLDTDKVSLKAYHDFSHALPKNGIVLDYGGVDLFSKNFWQTVLRFMLSMHQKK